MYASRKTTDFIIVYREPECSDVHDVERKQRAQGVLTIGYHFVVREDGLQQAGRQLDMVGFHDKARNRDSVAICAAGSNTAEQQFSLIALTEEMRKQYPDAAVIRKDANCQF